VFRARLERAARLATRAPEDPLRACATLTREREAFDQYRANATAADDDANAAADLTVQLIELSHVGAVLQLVPTWPQIADEEAEEVRLCVSCSSSKPVATSPTNIHPQLTNYFQYSPPNSPITL
jgi:hypothetical protein